MTCDNRNIKTPTFLYVYFQPYICASPYYISNLSCRRTLNLDWAWATTATMDQMMGQGGGGMGGQAGFPLETYEGCMLKQNVILTWHRWFFEMPVVTRYWTTATVLASALVQCQIITPFQLFYSFRAVFVKNQVTSYSLRSDTCMLT